jgi:acyl-CoA synthetase (AMP-forming)/AMP-acid ligase II
VAVVSRRSLDWLAAILGIFKAGRVYLPIDPSRPGPVRAPGTGRTTTITQFGQDARGDRPRAVARLPRACLLPAAGVIGGEAEELRGDLKGLGKPARHRDVGQGS